VPVLGPTIGAIPGVLIGLSISPLTGLAMLALYVVVQQLENSLLVPRIIGDSINIHPAVLTVVIIIAGTLFGIVGIILAAPVIAIARDLVVYSYRRLEGVAPPGAFAALGHTRG
jgi:predicted PurR-regulated permease PerM